MVVDISAKTNHPLVSVLVRTYPGRIGFLAEALASIIGQSYPHIEIIVVEDGGASVQQLINSFTKQQLINFWPLAKVGRCAAGNFALAQATGQYCMFLGDDDYLFSNHLQVLIDEIQRLPKIVRAVYSNAFEVPTQIISDDPFIYKETQEYSVNANHLQEFDRVKLWQANYISIQSVLFERSLFTELGGFDLELDCYEDWNLWVRYSAICEFRYINKTTSVFRIPLDHKMAKSRRTKIESYLPMALAKQDEIIVKLSIAEIKKMLAQANQDKSKKIDYALNIFREKYKITLKKLINKLRMYLKD